VRARVEAFEASRAKAVNRSRPAERAQKKLGEMRGRIDDREQAIATEPSVSLIAVGVEF
jgi:hypothetical protein